MAMEISEVPCPRTRSNARRGVDCGNSAALIATLVSSTAPTLLVTQERLQYIRRQAPSLGHLPGLIHDCLQRPARGGCQFLKPEAEKKLQLLLLAGRGLGKSSRRRLVHLDGDVRSSHDASSR